MARGRVIESDSEGEQTGSELSQSPSPPKKNKRKTSRTAKQELLDKENFDKAQQRLKKAKKELLKLKGKKKAALVVESDDDDLDLESEDSSDDDVIAFSSSIKPLPAVVGSDPETRAPLRPVNSKQANSVPARLVSRRTFSDIVATSSSGNDNTEATPPPTNAEAGAEPSPGASGAQKRPLSPTAESSSGHKRTKTIELCSGLNLKGRPTLSDFKDEVVQALLLRAMHEYEVDISTCNAFPSPMERASWAQACFASAQRIADIEIPYEFTERMSRLIQKRGSRIRGEVIRIANSLVTITYRFSTLTRASAQVKNKARVTELLKDGSFKYKNPATQDGYAQHAIVSQIIASVFFASSSSHGIVFPKSFNPVPVELIALVFTAIQFCIKRWSTGTRIKTSFRQSEVEPLYKSYLADLKKWEGYNLSATKKIREKIYGQAFDNAGVTPEEDPTSQLTGELAERVQSELAAYTGETESEESDVGGDD